MQRRYDYIMRDQVKDRVRNIMSDPCRSTAHGALAPASRPGRLFPIALTVAYAALLTLSARAFG